MLARVGATPSGGWTRLSWTPQDREARGVITSFMKEAGMEVRTDPAGNLIGRLKGRDPGAPPVASGSHIDTVPEGGMFDGAMGVILALEIAQAISDAQLDHHRPYEVIVCADEEGARFGAGLIGSRALAGQLESQDLEKYRDREGVTMAQAMEAFGLNPGKVSEARVKPGSYRAYLEVHAEQGRVLEEAGVPVGVVKAISAPVWLECTIEGRADHAGATPMNLRTDALLAACACALSVEKETRALDNVAVATVGQMDVRPGGINVIPGQVRFTVDIRHIDSSRRDALTQSILEAVERESNRRGCVGKTREIMRVEPVELSLPLQDMLRSSLTALDIPYINTTSGASHDAQVLASIMEVAMLFVRSRGGLSHCPEEYSDWQDITLAGNALLTTVTELLME